MSTYTQILYQVVFGSKKCTPFLTKTNQDELFRYMAGILKNKKCFTYIVGGHSNHIHLVFSLHRTIALADLVRDVKKASEEMMFKTKGKFVRFIGWQSGYGGFTYSYGSREQLIRYVENQAEHHRRISFREELIGFLKDFGVEYNEKYLFV
ncbi:MAG: transposase [Bacteroidota bacterium]